MAGSDAGTVALATASGRLLVVDGTTGALVQDVSQLADAVALSSDGTVLASHAAFTANGLPPPPDVATGMSIITVPQGFPITSVTGTTSFSLAESGSVAGWTTESSVGGTCSRIVAALPYADAGAVFSDTGHCPTPVVSPSGTYFAATDVAPSPSSTTFIYQGTNYLAAVPGVAKGWIDDGHLLVQTYTSTSATSCSATTIYDTGGDVLDTPSLPELDSFTLLPSNQLFAPNYPVAVGAGAPTANIYDWTSGALIFSTPSSLVGTQSTITPSSIVSAAPSVYPWGLVTTSY
jgi:hypothetical protein